MRVSINLASRPFIELRPLLARLRLGMAALTLLAVGLRVWSHALDQRARVASAQMDALKQETAGFQNERLRNEARMRQPQNKAVLDRSIFFNELFARKSFSWTATMMDLEHVDPPGVQVTSIEPVITKEGDVNIRLRVSGDRDGTIQLVRNLERSQRFVGARLAGESALTSDKARALGQVQNVSLPGGQAGSADGVEFDILSGYNPLPSPSIPAGAAARQTTAPRTAKPSAGIAAAPPALSRGVR